MNLNVEQIADHQQKKVVLFKQATCSGANTYKKTQIVEIHFPSYLLYGYMSLINYRYRNGNGTPIKASQLFSAYALYSILNKIPARSIVDLDVPTGDTRNVTTVWLPEIFIPELENLGYKRNSGTVLVRMLDGLLKCDDKTIYFMCKDLDWRQTKQPKDLGLYDDVPVADYE